MSHALLSLGLLTHRFILPLPYRWNGIAKTTRLISGGSVPILRDCSRYFVLMDASWHGSRLRIKSLLMQTDRLDLEEPHHTRSTQQYRLPDRI